MSFPKIEFRVPVSPTPEFALMLSVVSRSLSRYGGLNDSQITAFIGAPESDTSACEVFTNWLHPQIRAVIVDPADFQAQSFHATSARRLTLPSEADIVVLIDADILCCGNVSHICEQVFKSPALSGVIAHIAPLTRADWLKVFEEAGAQTEFSFRYTGWPYMKPQGMALSKDLIEAPAYFNFGFVVTTAELLKRIGANFDRCLNAVEKSFPNLIFRSQVALTLAAAAAGVPSRPIPMRYNFPNDYRLEALHPDELREARIIHLLRRTQGLDKQTLYKGLNTLREFIEAPWLAAGATERAREVLEKVLPDIAKNPPPDGLAMPPWAW